MKSQPGQWLDFIDHGGDKPGPSLEIELLGVNGADISTLALVDSGCEWTMMSLDLGKRLGAPLDQCTPVDNQTGGGLATGGLWWNDTPEGGEREEPMVRALGLEVPIAPIMREGIPIVALGREDFLASFEFCLDQRGWRFSLKPYDEPVDQWLNKNADRR